MFLKFNKLKLKNFKPTKVCSRWKIFRVRFKIHVDEISLGMVTGYRSYSIGLEGQTTLNRLLLLQLLRDCMVKGDLALSD